MERPHHLTLSERYDLLAGCVVALSDPGGRARVALVLLDVEEARSEHGVVRLVAREVGEIAGAGRV